MSTEEPKALAYQPGEAKTVSLGANIVSFLARREEYEEMPGEHTLPWR